MTTLIIVTATMLIVVSLGLTALLIRRAVDGYQDKDGFHNVAETK